MTHTYTVATTILVDIKSDRELTDYQLRQIMDECEYEVRGEGRFGSMWNDNRFRIADTEMEDWELVAEREEA